MRLRKLLASPLAILATLLTLPLVFAFLHKPTRLAVSDQAARLQRTSSSSSCDGILRRGRYIDTRDPTPQYWAPPSCHLKEFPDLAALQSCLRPGDIMAFLGDSTARMVYWAFVNAANRKLFQDDNVHGNHQTIIDGITFKLYWDPYLNRTDAMGRIKHQAQVGYAQSETTTDSRKLNTDPNYTPRTYLYVTTGLWHAMFEPRHEVMPGFKRSLDNFINVLQERVPNSFDEVYYIPTLLPNFAMLDPTRVNVITPEYISQMLKYTDEAFNYTRDQHGFGPAVASPEWKVSYVPVLNEIGGETHLGIYDRIGLHYVNRAIYLQKDIIMNHMCRNILPKGSHTCCVPYPPSKSVFPRFFVAATFTSVLLTIVLAWTFASTSRALIFTGSVVATVSAACGYAFLADRTSHIANLPRAFLPLEYGLLFQIALFVAIVSRKQIDQNLNTALLTESKGATTLLLLLGALTAFNSHPDSFAGEIVERLLITSWVTAHIFSVVRSLPSPSNNYSYSAYLLVLARALVLPTLLTVALSNPASPSWIPADPLVTKTLFWSILPAFILSPLPSDDTVASLVILAPKTAHLLRAVIIALVAFVVVVPRIPGLADDYFVLLALLFYAWKTLPSSTTSSTPPQLPSTLLNSQPSRFWTQTGCAAAAMAAASYVFLSFAFYFKMPMLSITPKTTFQFSPYPQMAAIRGSTYSSAIHHILAIIVIATYVAFRTPTNISSSSQHYVSAALIAVGSCSYELLVLRNNIFLSADGTARLHFLPTGAYVPSTVLWILDILSRKQVLNYSVFAFRETLRSAINLIIVGLLYALTAWACAKPWSSQSNKEASNEDYELPETKEIA
ncbi:uncharacterized protein SAPINGB_P002243 [Magnusiomyces paraingens]|uniref:Cas1p 10 TM acyl transferase domain-containing protein n=1 Tax=Magnusiomyces paraingens TaxID=2606893 RepID=A0A5E8BF61_9ASCO|nr:uncharacterized protein SAPINGB_P002243 [Saprochaete ingens]VVT49382.1 unnamed protein product [Saprochaete ingens]